MATPIRETLIVVGLDPARAGVSRYGDKVWRFTATAQVRLHGIVRRSVVVADNRGLTQDAAWARARDHASNVALTLTMPEDD